MATVTGMTAAATNAALAGKASTTHAATHAAAGSDPLTLSQSQITNLTSDLSTINSSLSGKAADSSVVHKGDVVINVKDYGALGNGTADDTAEITAAIAACPDGGTVYFPPGTYIVSSPIVLVSNITYRGSSRAGSVIKAASASNMHAVLASETWLSASNTYSDNPIYVYDLGIDGNKTNQSSGDGIGIALVTFWNTIQNLEVTDTRGHGILLSSARQDGTEIVNTAVECKIIACASRNAGGHGIYIHDPSSSTQTVTDGWVVDCVVADPAEKGIVVESSSGWLISGNHLYGVPKTAISFDRGGYTRIVGNYIETYGTSATATTYAGIMCGGDGSTWIGTDGPIVIANNTMFYSGGAAAGSSIRGIRLESSNGNNAQVVISGNALYGATHAAGSHGIRLSNQGSSASLNCRMSGNVLSGWDTQFSTSAASGTLNVSGDDFQTGIPLASTSGFLRLPTCAGTPTGTPADTSRGASAIYDTTANKLWVYNGAWKSVALT